MGGVKSQTCVETLVTTAKGVEKTRRKKRKCDKELEISITQA
jgi:hypothetical protein